MIVYLSCTNENCFLGKKKNSDRTRLEYHCVLMKRKASIQATIMTG